MTNHSAFITEVPNEAPRTDPLHLEAPKNLEEAGLNLDLIMQLLIKTLHFAGELSGIELADRLGLKFSVVEPGIDVLKAQHLCEIVGGSNVGAPSYRYRISSLGRERAMTFLAINKYTGIAPVPITQYRAYMNAFKKAAPIRASRPDVRRAFSHLVLTQKVLDQLGPAVNAGHSLFVYGPPGNGKTVVSQAIRNLLTGSIWIPHALDVDGQIIQVFDPVNHDPLPIAKAGPGLDAESLPDRRWIECRRPLVTVGGELVLESLELSYNPIAGFYRAPLQLVANGGVLVIDDFGRQRCSPHALLNRWIVPLENRIDHLTMQSGQKVEVPFFVLPVFATNLKPSDLVDEAFLRRIHYKVLVESPTEDDFRQIFKNVCAERDLPYDADLPNHLLETVYPKRQIEMRGCHPRDLIDQALSLAQYLDEPRQLTNPLLEAACDGYFVDDDQGVTLMG
jgi:hypothetical protein